MPGTRGPYSIKDPENVINKNYWIKELGIYNQYIKVKKAKIQFEHLIPPKPFHLSFEHRLKTLPCEILFLKIQNHDLLRCFIVCYDIKNCRNGSVRVTFLTIHFKLLK